MPVVVDSNRKYLLVNLIALYYCASSILYLNKNVFDVKLTIAIICVVINPTVSIPSNEKSI